MRDARLRRRDVLVDAPKKFVHERLELSDGKEIDWYYMDIPDSVIVVPVLPSGDLVLVKQYRHNLKADVLELPAGSIGEDEDPRAGAQRELREETGYEVASEALEALGRHYVLPSETNRYVNIYRAAPVRRVAPPRGDNEIERYFDMRVVEMTFERALASIGTEIHGLETIAALLLARRARPV